MSYSECSYSSNGQIIVSSATKIHWDIAISCFEPIEMVTGGIGTYTRLLLDILSNDPTLKNKNIALFCRKATMSFKATKPANMTIFEVPEDQKINGKNVTQLGDAHDWYSWNISHYLLDLTKGGHSFGFFEFPDYGVEAYFSLKMRRAGLLKIEKLGVRLHSPELMLFRDNLLPARAYDPNRLTRISRELFCYKHCDQVLYGAPAMLERVELECRRFGIEIRPKAVHVAHPYPVHGNAPARVPPLKRASIHLGYIGRLEVRKGILHFLLAVAESEVLRKFVLDLDIVFELFGDDCSDQNDVSIRSQILSLHKVSELRGRIVVHGYMSQENLHKKIKEFDGFVFPSLFENYPNALLEVLHTDAPILVSQAGGMPYISRGLPGIHYFSYDRDFTRNVENFFCSIRKIPSRKAMYFDMATRVNTTIVDDYGRLATLRGSLPAALRPIEAPAGVDFVMAFYNDAQNVMQGLKSVKAVMTAQDKLHIIDDVSRAEEFGLLEKAVAAVFGVENNVEIHRMPVNSGPSAARNVGAMMGRNPLIQLLDSDDHLNAMGFRATRHYMQNNKDVDFAYGIQSNFGGKEHVWVPRDSSAMTCLDENYTHSAILIRRSAFEGSGGFDDEMRLHFEDWQFNCKLALSGYRGEVVPFITLHCFVREGSRTFRNIEREMVSREQVIARSCMNRGPQETMLQGELLELIGKYSSLVNGRWQGGDRNEVDDGSITANMSLGTLCSLEGAAFVRAAYGVVLGRSADEGGLKFYLNQLGRGIGKRRIVADMLSSSEMRNKRRDLPKEYYKGLRFERFMRSFGLKRRLLRRA